jgi:hypothetical protein
MRLVVVSFALMVASVACGGTGDAISGAGGSGGSVQTSGGSGGTDVHVGEGGTGGALDPAARFDGDCYDPAVPRSSAMIDPLPVQFHIVPRDGLGLSCAGYLLEPRPGGADLLVYARTSAGTEWTAELGTDPRTTTPLHCSSSDAGQACLASFPADGKIRSVLIRITRDGTCVGALRQDLTVSDEGAKSGLQAMDPTLCP